MSSLTTRLALKRPDGTDPFLRLDFVNNWNKIDQYPGTFICTSSTRPTWGDAQIGINIYETDTKREYRWNGATWDWVNQPEFSPGDYKMSALAVAPSGWLLCDGAEVSRTTYAALFAAIGTGYGVGNGSTTFNLPDFRLRAPIGAGAGRALASNEGSAEGARNARWSHSHGHAASASVAGAYTGIWINGSGTGMWIDAANTNHNHAGPADHPSASNTPTGGSAQRVVSGGHGSTDLAAQAQGQAHNHGLHDPGHAHGVSDPGHAHGASATVSAGASADHPFNAVNFFIKT